MGQSEAVGENKITQQMFVELQKREGVMKKSLYTDITGNLLKFSSMQVKNDEQKVTVFLFAKNGVIENQDGFRNQGLLVKYTNPPPLVVV